MTTIKHLPERWALLIPGYFPPSLNNVAMAHWSKVRKHKKKAIELIGMYALQAGGLPVFEGPVTVRVTRLIGHRQRAYDLDNLFGSVKPLIDALRVSKKNRGKTRSGGLGIIEEDDPQAMALHVDQRKARTIETEKWLMDDLDFDLRPLIAHGSNGSGTVIIIEGKRIK